MERWIILGGSAAVAGYVAWRWGFPSAVQIVTGWVANTFERGHRLSSSTLVDGVVQESPEQLEAAAAGVLGFTPDADTLALARMGRSEGVDGEEYRMHVALNDLEHLQASGFGNTYPSVVALMTHSKNARADGHFSAQGLGKRYSTAHDPYEGDYALAQKVLVDRAAGFDPTGGARKFVDKDGLTMPFAALAATWAQEGLVPAPTLEGASDNFVTFVPA